MNANTCTASGCDRPTHDGWYICHRCGEELAQTLTDTAWLLDELDIVGIFPDYGSAEAAWRAKAQATVDNAHMRYFIVHLHRLLDPQSEGKAADRP